MVLDQLIILNWYFALFSSLLCLILYWYCKEKISLSHSWEVKRWGNWKNIWQLQLKAIISTSLAKRSRVSELGSLIVRWSKKCLISIVKRSLSWPRIWNSRTISSACWLFLMYDGQALTIGVINELNSTLWFLSISRSNCYDSFNFNGVQWLFDAKFNSASSSMCLELNILKCY